MSDSTNTNAVENTPVERIITIYATRGNSEPVDIKSSAVTWGDFIPEVEKAGYSVNKVLCTESHRRSDLVNKLAILPDVDFTIFIRNKETKSGAEELSYKELRAEISGFIAADGERAKAHFNETKNYTTKTTAELKALHASYTPAQAGTEEVVEAEEVAESSMNVADVVETVAKAKVIIITNTDRIAKIELLLSQIKGATSNEEISERVDIVMDEVAGLRDAISVDENETPTEVPIEEAVAPAVDPAEEGREQARKEAKEAEEAKIAAEKEAEEAEKQAKIARKKKLADEAKSLGL